MRNNKIMCLLLHVIAIISVFTMFLSVFNKGIWVDEAFSLKLIQHSYKDLVILTAQDVHPPLYYIILKFCVDIGSYFNILDKYSASIVSIIPYIILIYISLTKIRRQWGLFTSSMFVFCISQMPNFLSYSTEIRMYSFGLLFVTLAYIEVYEIMLYCKLKNWISFLIYGLCAAYTHYFAFIPIVFLYGYLFFWCILKKRKELMKLLLISLLTFIIYLPWLIIVIKQVAQVKESYWIGPITLATVYQYVQFVFNSNSRFIYMLLLILIYAYMLILMLLRRDKTIIIKSYILTGFLILVLTIFVGILLSFILRPIFISRYIFPSLGCFWLCFSININFLKSQKYICTIVIACLVFIGALNYKSFIKREYLEMRDMAQVQDILKSIDADVLVVSNDNQVHRSLAYYLKSDVYIWNNEDSNLSNMVYGNIKCLNSELLETKISNKISILYWKVKGYDDMIENLDKNSLQINYLGDVNFAHKRNISIYLLDF